MLAVAGLRSRASRTISVRPPLSSVMSRSATTFTRSSLAPPAAAASAHRRLPCRPAGPAASGPETADGNGNARRRREAGAGTPAPRLRRCRSHIPALRFRGSAASPRGHQTRLDVSLPSEMTSSAFLRFLPCFRQRNRFCHRVVHRRAAVRHDPPERARQQRAVASSSLCSRIGSLLNRYRNISSSRSRRS